MSAAGNVPEVDGVLDEIIWQRASVATDFVQLQPTEGAPASERSEVRVLYGHDALYVGFRAYDSDPDAIEAQLTRRDQGSFSDWVHVAVDSYHDRRTAFQFGANPVGVKRDAYRYDDTHRDSDWDAVWDVATTVDDEGWTAEFRIPYSQLRFTDTDQQTWGIQFTRWIARKDEAVYWSPLTGDLNAVVSRFGNLVGLTGIEPRRRIEVTPYALARLRQAPEEGGNPFYQANDTFDDVGIDVKYGLTSNLTLDVTVNPDFGQVEADPAQVNLSEFETFFPERRPFFLEGANIFEFGIGGGDRLFHSRRIGRRPQGHANTQGGHADIPENTTIQAAAKVTGKTESDVTIGVLYASTARESADIMTSDGEDLRQVVEPATQYGVVRLQKDFREGRTVLGLVATGVSRDSEAQSLGLHDNSFTGGVDFQHEFWDQNYRVSGYLLGSRFEGSPDAIARTQRAPGRYMQRPDADHLTYDPTRTSLSGMGAQLSIDKVAGGFWRYSAGLRTRTPEFDANDMGFLKRADFVVAYAGISYNHYLPSKHFRQWRVSANTSHWESTGGERTGLGASIKARLQFHNHWSISTNANFDRGSLSLNSLRGGPALRTDDKASASVGLSTDGREKLQFSFNLATGASRSGSRWFGAATSASWRPSGRLRVNVGGYYNAGDSQIQWVTKIGKDRDHYVFGRMQQEQAGFTVRVDYAFTRNLTLELYTQPFVSAGDYSELKQVTDPLARDYADRYDALTARTVDHGFMTDVDGDGAEEFIHDPSFNFKQFRSNAVLRWEYSPGSTLFAVWSHGRKHYAPTGDFNLGSNIGDLFDAPADDVFMIKVNYWISPTGWFSG